MAKVFFNVSFADVHQQHATEHPDRLPRRDPTLEEVAELLGLPLDAFDAEFGVVEIDPDVHLYTVLVDEQAVAATGPRQPGRVSGPYSNPRIEPFGPPEAAAPADHEAHGDETHGDEAHGNEAHGNEASNHDTEER